MASAPKWHKSCVDEEACPLVTLQELLDWQKPEKYEEVRKLQQPQSSLSSQPLTLVCHDMKGGYLDDRFKSGCCNKNAYRFYHWSGVDIFVYFSHHLVTIPPPVWIDAAHLHGVTVLGTFITEWETGSAVCKELLDSEETVAKAVHQLTRIALFYGFEGWLINIENEVPAAKIPLLLHFVRELTAAMRAINFSKNMRKNVINKDKTKENSNKNEENLAEEKSLMYRKNDKLFEENTGIHHVIWYDSVTENGKLEWQNELNPLNQPFFNACDGIFLNYTWTESHLDKTKKAASVASSVSGDSGRVSDVFVGLDMFGRNFYAGGKYNTWKALELVRKYDFSAAIFAPGWTYETQDKFDEAEKRMWRSLAPFLYHKGPHHLPLTTSFCQGYGDNFYWRGKVERKGEWHNLSLQEPQPLWLQMNDLEEEHSCLSLVTQDAYNGGGCLGITSLSCITVRLFLCDLEWKNTLSLSVTYKWCNEPTSLSLLCRLSRIEGDVSVQNRILECRCEEIKEEEVEEGKQFGNNELITECRLLESHINNEWNVRIFIAEEVPGYKISEVCLRIGCAADLRLGHLGITNTTEVHD